MNFSNEKAETHPKEPVLNYPGSKASLDECIRVYESLMSSYDKIYERINIVVTIAGLVLLVGVDNINGMRITNQNPWAAIAILLSFIGLFFVGKSLLSLITLLKSSGLSMIDPNFIQAQRLYEKPEVAVEMLWIDRYIEINNKNRKICQQKQKKLDTCVSNIIYAVLMICLSLLINNIGGF